MEIAHLNLYVGWLAMLGGVLSGAVIGMCFQREEWMGGYTSHRRRLTRLGHISFWGLGIVNLLFVSSLNAVAIPVAFARVASVGLVAGAVTMPVCCFLTAWRDAFRHLFPLPVLGILGGIVSLLLGWAVS